MSSLYLPTTQIEWATHVANFVSGCTRGCSYCYARRMAQRLRGRAGYPQDEPFRPTWHEEMWLRANPQKPARILLSSMGDIMEAPDQWVKRILRRVRVSPEHIWIFLTKNPHLLAKWNPWPKNAWVGATATDSDSAYDAYVGLTGVDAPVRFFSFEPLLNEIVHDDLVTSIANWLIIGAMTGPGYKLQWPQREWVEELVAAADWAGIPVFEKNNLAPIMGRPLRQEVP